MDIVVGKKGFVNKDRAIADLISENFFKTSFVDFLNSLRTLSLSK